MDIVRSKWKKNVLVKAWERGMSKGQSRNMKPNCTPTTTTTTSTTLSRSKSCHNQQEDNMKKNKINKCPNGCFCVYVGPKKQRFVVKTELANHPLFRMLLEDAETEYGYNSNGPILLPCDVDLFYKVLAEMDSGDDGENGTTSPTWTSPFLVLCSPARRPPISHYSSIESGKSTKSFHGGYRLLSPSRMLKLNQP